MKKLWFILLALALFVLPGCHNEMDDLMGSWQVELDRKDLLLQRLEQECPGIDECMALEALTVTVELTFYADGTYQAQVDQQSVRNACDALRPSLEQGIWDYWCALYRQKNPEDSLETYVQSLGVTRQELMDEVLGDTLPQELILQMDMREEGRFSVKDGKLRFSASADVEPDKQSWHRYQVKGKKLTIKPGEYPGEQETAWYQEVLPLVLQKK